MPGAAAVGEYAAAVHCKPGITNRIALREAFGFFRITLIQRDDGFPAIKAFDTVVNAFGIIALVRDKSTLGKRKHGICSGEEIKCDRTVGDIRGAGHVKKGQPGDTVHEDVVLVAPVERNVLFAGPVGSGVDAETAVRIRLRLIFRIELTGKKGLGVILAGISGNGSGVKSDKGSVDYALRSEKAHLFPHDPLQEGMVNFFQEAVKRPVGGQGLRDIEAAVVCDQEVVVQVIHEVGDHGKALALHHEEGTDHSVGRKPPATGVRVFRHRGQVK